MLAEIEKRINDENARPKKRYISPATREEVYALYYDQLRRKIEDRGTRNFPENQGKKLYGELTMIITVDAEGRVVDTEIVRGSGNKVLDRRAVAIVHAAGPYGRFTPAMRKQADQIAIPSRFRFTREEGLETTLSGRVSAAMSRYAVIGHPVAHSQSPFIHAAFAAQTGEPVSYERLLCPLDGFAAAVRAFAAGGASGCNVTMPFKFEAFDAGRADDAASAHRRRLQHAALRRRRLARRQHRRRRPGARHRAQRRRRPARRARPADRRRRRRGRRARRL